MAVSNFDKVYLNLLYQKYSHFTPEDFGCFRGYFVSTLRELYNVYDYKQALVIAVILTHMHIDSWFFDDNFAYHFLRQHSTSTTNFNLTYEDLRYYC